MDGLHQNKQTIAATLIAKNHTRPILAKFSFKNIELALKVRETVYQMLILFDKNNNYEFEEQQIEEILKNILEENINEILYVIKNVFRYDANSDGKITYDEFVNFCVELHFGEIAIQRLHRKQLYSRGKQRVMTKGEFYQTISYALSFVKIRPDQKQLDEIFTQIDQDADLYISYEDYFRFLKEYFGSRSVASNIVQAFSVLEEQKIEETHLASRQSNNTQKKIIEKYQKYFTNNQIQHNIQQSVKQLSKQKQSSNIQVNHLKAQILDLEQEIVKLIYSQLHVIIMNFDRSYSLSLNFEEILHFITFLYQNSEEKSELLLVKIQKIIKQQPFEINKSYSYEKIMLSFMKQHISFIFNKFKDQSNCHGSSEVMKEKFCQLFEEIAKIVPATPISQKVSKLYELILKQNQKCMTFLECMNLINKIFLESIK